MTTQGVSVRRAGTDDGPTLAWLRRAWAEEEGQVADPSFDEWFGHWLQRETDRRIAWVALQSAQPVGMLNLTVFVRMPRPGRREQRWGYVANVFVLAEHRNAGVGTALLEAAVAHARGEGFVRLVLNPSERSVPLYERFGFRPSRLLQLDLET
ncbi:MAG: GNAT family N-acetyltransferase [Jiangellaceae bacterium]